MEVCSDFMLEGWVEMAWIMGYIIEDLYDSVIDSLNAKVPETKLKAAPQPHARCTSPQFLCPQVPGDASIWRYLRVLGHAGRPGRS